MVCEGVWVDEQGGLVAVKPKGPDYDNGTGTTLTEYSDPEGNVRACLLSVPTGCASRTWEITPRAEGYRGHHRIVAGRGIFDRWTESQDGGDTQTYEPFGLPGSAEPVTIQRGNTFRVYTSRGLGVRVLATFSGTPFIDDLRPASHRQPFDKGHPISASRKSRSLIVSTRRCRRSMNLPELTHGVSPGSI